MDQAAYDATIFRILEANEEERRAQKMAGLQQLSSDLLEHASQPKNSCPKIGEPIDAESAGLSAAQYFAGEDKHRAERRRMQQAQMRQWTVQQVAEKSARSNEEKEDAMRYNQYLSAVNDMREQIEMNEQQRVKEDRYTVRQLNQMRAAEKEELRQKEAELNDFLNNREFEYIKNDAFINEETDASQSTLASYRVRPDHFKGFNKAQTMYIYKKNEELVGHNKDAKAEERAEADAWANHTKQVVRMMEQNEEYSRNQTAYRNQVVAEEIGEQRRVQQERKEQSRADKFGAINGGYFDGFGTSCR
jgi:hypothetical protein